MVIVREHQAGVAKEPIAAEVAQAILAKADEHCFEGWELRQDMDAMLTREFTLLLADQYRDLGLIGTDKDFVSRCIRLLRRVRYRGGQGAS